MYEELLINNNSELTVHPRIMKGNEEFIHWKDLTKEINILDKYIKENNIVKIISHLEHIVQGYKSLNNIVDVAFVEKKNIEI